MRSTSRRFSFALLAASLGFTLAATSPALSATIAFDLPTEYATVPFPLTVAAGDLNGDGHADLAVTNPDAYTDPNRVSILLNAGDGTFLPAVTLSTGEIPRSITSADLDADGDVDLLVGYQSGDDRLAILRNDGLGSFGAPEFFAEVVGRADVVVVRDLDGDQDGDILIGQAGGDEIVVVKNMGVGVFAAPVTYGGMSPAYFLQLAVGDVDADGDLDVVVGRSLSTPGIYRNLGDGTFAAPAAFPFVPFAYAVCDLGDVDGDGDLDIAFVSETGPGAFLALNDGSGTFTSGGPFYCGADTHLGSQLALADLDGDGRADVIVPGANTYRVATVRSAPAGFEAPVFHPLGGIARRFALGDLDADGDLDLAGAIPEGDFLSVLLNQLVTSTSALAASPLPRLLLEPARPNPVRVAASVPFNLQHAARVRLDIVDLQGRLVRSLVDEITAAGPHTAAWDARDERGVAVSAGVYFVKLEAGELLAASRIVVVR